MRPDPFLKYGKIVLGPAVGALVCWLLYTPEDAILAKAAFVAVWMAIWWITDAIPIYATAFIPAVLFPLLGIMDMKEVAPQYFPQILFLFIGGFILAFAMEKWNLHKRIALKLILSIGNSPSRVLFGFMLASWFLSQWILNTATCMMLLPAVLAVISQVENFQGGKKTKLAIPLLLGLAYASSIGGTATLIGTAPNVYFFEFFNENFKDYEPLTFANWFAFGFPMSVALFICCYFLLKIMYMRKNSEALIEMSYCRTEYQKLGRFSYEEWVLNTVFVITVLLWFFMKDINFGSFTLKGWSNLLPDPSMAKESTVAMVSALLLFLIPSTKEEGRAIVTWGEASHIPFGVLLLFGGGFALAKGIDVSGLGKWLASYLEPVTSFSPFLMVLILCAFMTFFTELTSNTTSTILLLSLLMPIAKESDYHPLLLMLPVTLCASFAFMLPVATPPNTIVFGIDRLLIKDMMRTGIWLNLVAVGIVWIFTFTLGKAVFGF